MTVQGDISTCRFALNAREENENKTPGTRPGQKASPHPEERRPLRRVSKDEATARASWFETRCCASLLTMRRWRQRVKGLQPLDDRHIGHAAALAHGL